MATKKNCTRKKIQIKSKRGKVIAEFMGHTGAGCGPRPKPSTRHLAPFKKNFALQARACKGNKRGKFLQCMRRIKGSAGVVF